MLRFTAHYQVNKWKRAHGGDIHHGRLRAAQYNHGLPVRPLDFAGDAKRYRVAAANRTEAKEVKITTGEIISGKTAKINLVAIRIPQPAVINTVQVDNFRLQTLGFQNGGKAQDADRGKLAHDASRFHFVNGPVIEPVGRRRTDEADFHLCHCLGGRERMRPIPCPYSL